MKLPIALLLLPALWLAVIPAIAQTDLYDNGPINGTTNAWLINFGSVVSDTFTVGSGGASITGLSFGAWNIPSEYPYFVEVSITSSEFGGTTYFDQYVNLTQSNCFTNQYGFYVCTETGSFSPVNLAAGTYWLNLQNAQEQTNDPVYWDENSGPSSASENSVGTIPSEAFTILGTNGTSTTTSGTVPEPGSILLFGSSMLGLAGILRRNLF